MPVYHEITTDEQLESFKELRQHKLLRGDRVWVVMKDPENVRSFDQNSLFQRWARLYAAHLLKIDDPKEVTEEIHNHMKYTLQRRCYADTGWDYLLVKQADLISGEERVERKSTTKLEVGEMHQFLNWVQARAADEGLILESLGEYRDLQQSQVA